MGGRIKICAVPAGLLTTPDDVGDDVNGVLEGAHKPSDLAMITFITSLVPA